MRFTCSALVFLLLPVSCAGFRGELILAPGTYKHDVKGTTGLDDRTSGSLVRLRTEGYGSVGFGGGVALDGLGSKDDLFDGEGAYGAGDLFAYGGFEVRAEEGFRMPLRLGFLFSGRVLELEDALDTEIQWASAGVGLELAPQVRLAGSSDEFSLWVFGDFRMAVMTTEIEVKSSLGAPTWDTTSVLWGAHMGLRAQVEGFYASLGYIGNLFVATESDLKYGSVIRESSDTFNGVALGLGLSF